MEMKENLPFKNERHLLFKTWCMGLGQVAQVVSMSSQYANMAGLIPGQSMCKNQVINA